MYLGITEGNLLESDAQYICHQCNCVSSNSAGLAHVIFEKYPYADVYSNRTSPSVPGQIIISGNGQDQRYIINMFSQYYPGMPKYPNSNLDGFQKRLNYFNECLSQIAKIDNLISLDFPWQIGCGLAGGDWNTYKNIIETFGCLVTAKIRILKLKE